MPVIDGFDSTEPIALSKASTVTGVSKFMGNDTWANPRETEKANADRIIFFMIFDFDAFLQNYLFVKNTLSFGKGSLLSSATKIFL
jgi:hypothetical protein